MNNLTVAYLKARRWPEAETTAHRCLDLFEKKQPDDWRRFQTMSQLGPRRPDRRSMQRPSRCYSGVMRVSRTREAKIPAPRKKDLAAAAARIVPFYEAWGKPEKAAEWRTKIASPATEEDKPMP